MQTTHILNLLKDRPEMVSQYHNLRIERIRLDPRCLDHENHMVVIVCSPGKGSSNRDDLLITEFPGYTEESPNNRHPVAADDRRHLSSLTNSIYHTLLNTINDTLKFHNKEAADPDRYGIVMGTSPCRSWEGSNYGIWTEPRDDPKNSMLVPEANPLGIMVLCTTLLQQWGADMGDEHITKQVRKIRQPFIDHPLQ